MIAFAVFAVKGQVTVNMQKGWIFVEREEKTNDEERARRRRPTGALFHLLSTKRR